VSEAAGGDGRPHATRNGSTPSSLSVWEPDIGVLGTRDSSMRCVCPRCVCVCAEVWGRARWWVAELGGGTENVSRLPALRLPAEASRRRGGEPRASAQLHLFVRRPDVAAPADPSKSMPTDIPLFAAASCVMDPPWLRENGGSRAIAQYAPHVGAEWPENRRMRSCEWTATRQPPRMQSVPTPMEGPPGSDDLVDRALVLLRHQFLRGVPQSGPSGSGSVET
jgi:hypothetical protein